MTDFDKPMGFIAVNGRQPSPPRSQPGGPQLERESSSANGTHTLHRNDSHTMTPGADDRPPVSTQPSLRVGAQDQDISKSRPADGDRSPSRKRTYPEAFDEAAKQSYPPRLGPREGSDYRSPDTYQDAQSHPSYGSAPVPVQAGSPYSTDAGLDETDRKTMEALKANSGTASPSRDQYDGHEDDEDDDRDSMSQHGMGHMVGTQMNTPNRTAAGVITKDSAKRKRVFSNRTKTGCLTCRKRKKKCDEQRPDCQNCTRGGFVCEGYTPRSSWQKPSQSQSRQPALAQLQSKGPGMAPQRQHSMQYSDTPQSFTRRPDMRHEDPRRELPMSAGPPPPPHHHDPVRQPYPRADGRYPSHVLPRYDGDAREHGPPNGAHHEPGPYPPPPAASFASHQGPLHHGGAPPAPMHHGAPATAMAQAALEHVSATLPPASTLMNGSSQGMIARRPGEPSERDKMLQGDYYLPYTPILRADRDQCMAAVYRFNQACQNPSLGFAHIDRERLFREIIHLRPAPDPPCVGSPIQTSVDDEPTARADAIIPRGSVGAGCIVEAPFHCDYGYNLTIGSDVVIGAGCRITDTCNVTISSGAVLSPGVTLMCSTYGIDPKERRGKGRQLSRGIMIEEEAWIGTNVTILPGVRIGKCATVGAGSMIHKDVPPFTVVAGNPPKVVRGIQNEDDR